MSNKIFMRADNVIAIEYHGDQNQATIDDLVAHIVLLLSELREKQIPVRLISDNRGMGARPDPSAWRKAVGLLHREPFEKIAVVGADDSLTRIGLLVLESLGLQHKYRYFDHMAEAEDWLAK